MFRADEVTEIPKVEFGCGGPTDVFCRSTEQVGRWTADLIGWMAHETLGSTGISSADDNGLWSAAITEANMWLSMTVIVMFITAIVALTVGALAQRTDLVKRAAIGSALSIPAVMFAYFIAGQGLQVIDDFSEYILTSRLDSDGGFGNMLTSLFIPENGSTGTPGESELAAVPRMLMVLVVMAIALLFMMVAMAFRDFVVLLLIAFAPLAFVLLPAKGGGEWVKRWVSALTAMALAKPILLGTVALIMSAFGQIDTIYSAAGLTLVIGFVLASFMPLLVYSFFSFMGGGTGGDQVGSRAGSAATQQARSGAGKAATVASRFSGGGGGGGATRGAAPASTPATATANHASAQTQSGTQQNSGPKGRPGAGPGAGDRLPDQARTGKEQPKHSGSSRPGGSQPGGQQGTSSRPSPQAPPPQVTPPQRPQAAPPQQPNRGQNGGNS